MNALRAFEAVGRHLSFTRAAQELNVTHGALSRQVRLLEEWLGQPLFERGNRRISLTERGADYLSDVGAAFDRIAAATARQFKRDERRLLQVNAMATFTLADTAAILLSAWPPEHRGASHDIEHAASGPS